MKRRQTRKQRKTRRNKKQRRLFSRRRQYKGGANLPVPNGSVVAVELDPKDRYGVPVLVSKEIYEDEIIKD